MKAPLLLLIATSCVVLFGGCAVYSDAELAQFQRRGVASPTLQKLERRQPLSPGDIVEMHRSGLGDPAILRQLERVGVDSLYTRNDFVRLRGAGVSARVVDAAVSASDRFEARHSPAPVVIYDAAYEEPWGVHGGFGWGWYGGF